MMATNPRFNPQTSEDRITVICLHCQKPIEVPRRVITFTCKYCHKPLRLEDIQFKKYEARRVIETCGTITIEKNGNVVAEQVRCGAMIVRGKLRGNVSSRSNVLVGPEAQIRGNVTAPQIAIGAGAILEGDYRIGPDESTVQS
ncbi:MAG: polymer-forming cytoskeletal protein [Phycisphaerales bacterium]|nr:polymer-forming cytoskeletal protein [Phycisphaerales bacterium]